MTSSTSSTSTRIFINPFQTIRKTFDDREISFTIEGSFQHWVVKTIAIDCPQIKSGDFSTTLNLREAIHAYSLLRNTAIESVTREQIELDTSAPDHRGLARWLHALPSTHAMTSQIQQKAAEWIKSLVSNDDDDEKGLDRGTVESLLHLSFCPYPPVCQAAIAVLNQQTGVYAEALQNIFKEQKYEDFLLLETLDGRLEGENSDKVFVEFTTFLVERLNDKRSVNWCLDFKAIEILKCPLEDKFSPLRKQAADLMIVLIEKVSLSPYARDLLRNLLEKIAQEKELQSCAEAIRKKLNAENRTRTIHPLLVKFQEALKKSYCEGSASTIERFLDKATLPIGECFIRLGVVLDEEHSKKEKQLEDPSLEQNNYETFEKIYKPEKSIPFPQLFRGPSDRHPSSHVLVEGRAGIGKSTFCKYIANQWATLPHSKREEVLGSWAAEFGLVIHLPLREVALELEKKSLSQIIRDFYFPMGEGMTEGEVKELLSDCEEQGKVLYLLDGYDEVEHLLTNEKLKRQFSTTLLQKKHWILTSRPGFYHDKKERHLEIVGFESDDILNYVDQYFGKRVDPATSLKEEIERSPILGSIAPIPILLEFLCTIWSENQTKKKPLDNATALYDEIVADLFRRAPSNLTVSQSEWTTKEVLTDSSNQKVLHFLEKLSWAGIDQDILIFKPENYLEVIRKYRKSKNAQSFATRVFQRIGLLKERTPLDKARPRAISQREYYFLHFSFQEYFAARHLAHRISKATSENSGELKEELAKLQKERRFRNVFAFTAGLLAHLKDDQPLNFFFETICQKLDGVVTYYGIEQELELPLLCLEQVEVLGKVAKRTQILSLLAKYISLIVSERIHRGGRLECLPQLRRILTADEPLLASAWEEVYVAQGDNRYLTSDLFPHKRWFSDKKVYPSPLFRRLESDLTSVQEESVSRGLGWASALSSWDGALLEKLVRVTRHQSNHLRVRAINTLGHGTRNKDWIAKELHSLLEFESPEVQFECIEAIRQLKVFDREIIAKIVTKLEDPSEDMRMFAVVTLGELSVIDAGIIEKIVTKLEDPKEQVRTAAVRALGELRVTDARIIEKIVTKLEDPDKSLRCAALGALGRLKITDRDILEKIVAKFDDSVVEVSWAASYALGKLKVADAGIIEKIVDKLEDRKSGVREAAVRALGELKVKDAVVVKKIVSKLEDADDFVRRAVVEAVRNLKITDVEIIQEIVVQIDSLRPDVRMAACNALENLKVTDVKIIERIGSKLDDPDKGVRKAACNALGNLKVTDVAIIKKIGSKLRSPRSDMRSSAVHTLRKLKVTDAGIINKIVAKLGDDIYCVKKAAIITLVELKVTDARIIEKILDKLDDSDDKVKKDAAKALAELKVTDALLTEKITDKLRNCDTAVRNEYTSILRMQALSLES